MQEQRFDLQGPQPGRSELENIVARAGRYRRRKLVAVAALSGAVALGAGWVLGSLSKRPARVVVALPSLNTAHASASSPAASPASPPAGAAVAKPETGSQKWTRLFVRSAGQATVRAYEFTSSASSTPISGCRYLGVASEVTFEAEVSTPQIVGTLTAFGYETAAVSGYSVTAGRIGIQEGAPLYVVAAQVPAGVSEVTLSGMGTAAPGAATADRMVPVGGWAVLVMPAASLQSTGTAFATLSAYGSDGRLLHQASVTLGTNGGIFLQPRVCFGGVGPVVPPHSTTVVPSSTSQG
ncbi:MAG: hypothetical protein ACP5P1_02910 [Acidimicrobiales bacterium]